MSAFDGENKDFEEGLDRMEFINLSVGIVSERYDGENEEEERKDDLTATESQGALSYYKQRKKIFKCDRRFKKLIKNKVRMQNAFCSARMFQRLEEKTEVYDLNVFGSIRHLKQCSTSI